MASGFATTTDASGHFFLPNVPPGQAAVQGSSRPATRAPSATGSGTTAGPTLNTYTLAGTLAADGSGSGSYTQTSTYSIFSCTGHGSYTTTHP